MPQQRSVTRDVPLQLRAAEFDLSTLDVDNRTVELVWTTGAAVLRGGIFTEPYWEELSLDPKHVDMRRLTSGAAPLLNSHRSGDIADILGVVDGAWLTPTEGRAKVRFDSGPAGSDAMRRVAEKTLRNVSVGYQTLKMQEVDGKDPKIPTYRAIQWQPYELSLLPIGADAGAVTRSGGGALQTYPCVFIQERAMPDPVENAPANPNPNTAPSPTAPAPVISNEMRAQIEKDAARAATERVLGIQRVGRALSRPQAEIDAAVANPSMTLEQFRTAAVDALADAPQSNGGTIPFDRRGHQIQVGEDSRDKFRKGASAWLITRAALGNVVANHARANNQTIDLDPGEFRGLSLIDLARESLERAGVNTRGMSKLDLVGHAFTHRSGMATSSDFAVLLENVQGKVLLARYATTPDTYTRVCKIGSVSDFRASPRYRQGSFGTLDNLLEGGEYVQKAVPDGEKQSITADTVGNIIAISRKTIINDDMGALTGLASDLGRAAKLSIEVDFYALLALNAGLGPLMLDGKSLFHADHANIATQAALSAANLDLDRVKLGSQMDPSGNEVLDLKPAILLVSNTLGGQARVINDSQYDPDATANKALNRPNVAAKMFSDIVDTARMSGTRRYIFADPGIAPTIEVVFLDGQQNPYLESQAGFDVDGVKWKVRLDYAVGAIDHRGAVTNAG